MRHSTIQRNATQCIQALGALKEDHLTPRKALAQVCAAAPSASPVFLQPRPPANPPSLSALASA